MKILVESFQITIKCSTLGATRNIFFMSTKTGANTNWRPPTARDIQRLENLLFQLQIPIDEVLETLQSKHFQYKKEVVVKKFSMRRKLKMPV